MKKLLSGFFAVIIFAGVINAQSMSVGAGVVASFPMGDFGEAANTGFGGTAAFEMRFMPMLVGVGQIGYIVFGTESDNVDFSTVPLLFGVKYFFVPGVGFYGLGQLGLNFFSTSVDIPGFGTFDDSSTEFTLAIGAGYEVPVSPTFILDFSGGIHIISDANNFQLRAGGKVGI